MFSFKRKKRPGNDALLNVFSDLQIDTKMFTQQLDDVCRKKDADNLDLIMQTGFTYKLYALDTVDILCKLLVEDWHYCHENIASILQDLKSPKSVEPLYKAAQIQFEYLNYDEAFAFATKCIWALGDINTSKAREKLKLLALSDNEVIKREAAYQLNRH